MSDDSMKRNGGIIARGLAAWAESKRAVAAKERQRRDAQKAFEAECELAVTDIMTETGLPREHPLVGVLLARIIVERALRRPPASASHPWCDDEGFPKE